MATRDGKRLENHSDRPEASAWAQQALIRLLAGFREQHLIRTDNLGAGLPQLP